MKTQLKPGTAASLTTKVGPGNTITLGGQEAATVFSTPSMINLMEYAAREALHPHLDDGEESVGIDVQITHSSATPPESKVIAEATVTAIEKNVVSFELVARDAWGEIGRGTHRRAVIKTSKFAERLAHDKSSDSPASNTKELPKFQTLEVARSGGILSLTLNRPHKRNAISPEMTHELETLVDWLQHNEGEVRIVTVTGASGTFCAGDDVGELPESPEAAKELSLRRGQLYQKVTSLPQVFIAAIDGLALGGGFVLACSCDIRVLTHSAKLGLPEVSLGWPPNYGLGIVRSVVGRPVALQLSLTGQPMDLRQPLPPGLAYRIVASARLEDEVTILAKQLAAMPQDALGSIKQLIPADRNIDSEATESFLRCLNSPEAQASMRRFR